MDNPPEDPQPESSSRHGRRRRLNLLPLLGRRWFQFLAALVTGFAIGLIYGWVLNPAEYRDTSLDTLHADYRTDYVLMAAETYSASGDVRSAVDDLDELASDAPLDLVLQALEHAATLGYSQADIACLQNLATALQAWNSPTEGAQP